MRELALILSSGETFITSVMCHQLKKWQRLVVIVKALGSN